MKFKQQESTTSLLLRNLIFTALQPGLVAGVIPYYIIGGKIKVDKPWQLHTYAGIILFAFGLVVMLQCVWQFAIQGRGTLSPVDPTKRLVIRGLYSHSRNPMYVGVMMMLIGEAIITRSYGLWIYMAIIFVAFNLFIIFHEEPRLRRDFGQEYEFYCERVRRWF